MLFTQVWLISLGSILRYVEFIHSLGDSFDDGWIIDLVGETVYESETSMIYRSVRAI